MKKHPVLRNLLIDILCAGLVLIVFALFHHVLPRQEEGLGIVIRNPYQEKTDSNDSGSSLYDPETLIASAGVSDSSTLSAAGRRKNGGKNGGGMNDKGGSALTDSGTEEENGTPEDTTPLADKFADRYTDTVTLTENSYTSPNISITSSTR